MLHKVVALCYNSFMMSCFLLFLFLVSVFNDASCADLEVIRQRSKAIAAAPDPFRPVGVFYRGPNKSLSGCLWDIDRHVGNGTTLHKFMQDFVTKGVSVWSSVPHEVLPTFISKTFDESVLRGCFLEDVQSNKGVKKMTNVEPLCKTFVSALPPLIWRTYKNNSGIFFPPQDMVISFDFPGGAIIGLPCTDDALALDVPEWTCCACTRR